MVRAACLALMVCAACGEPGPVAPNSRFDGAMSGLAATLAQGGGELQVRRRDEAWWEPGRIGTLFISGDWLRSGGLSFGRVEYTVGGRLDLDEHSMVIIETAPDADDPDGQRERVLAVEEGIVDGVLEHQQQVVIKATDKTRARLRAVGEVAVEYRVTRKKQGTEVALRSGEAVLSTARGSSTLKAGDATEVRDEGAPAVVRLLLPPTGLSPANEAHLAFGPTPVLLHWTGSAGAVGYRVQIARDAAFRELVLSEERDAASCEFQAPTPGLYYWRLWATDEAGRWSDRSSAARLHVDPPAAVDHLRSPAPDAEIETFADFVPVRFEWEALEGGSYRLLVGRRTDLFQDPVTDERLSGSRFEVSALPVGEYYWGVYSTGDEELPLFSQPRRLVVRKVSKSTVKVPKKLNDWGP